MNPALTMALITHFGCVLTRVSAFAVACPVFLPDGFAFVARGGVVAVLALSLSMTQPHVSTHNEPVLSLLGEGCIGAALGMIVRCAASAVRLAGDLIDGQIGFGFSKIFDPVDADEVGPFQHLFHILVSLGFCLSGGFEAVVRGLALSYRAFPAGTGADIMRWSPVLVEHIGAVFSAGLRIAMPMIVALSVTQLALAIMSRLAPQLNLWSAGFACTLAVGLFCCAIFTPYLIAQVGYIWQEQTDSLYAMGAP